MEGLNVRRMTIADAPVIARIEAETFARPWSLADFQSEMTNNPVARYLVAEKDGQILGYAGAHIILDEGHVTNAAVIKSERGKGVGRMLMRELMQYAANLGVCFMTLEVRVSNQAAIALYRSLGFIQVSVRKRYYEDNGEDAWLMVCDRLPVAQEDFVEAETLKE